MSYVSGPGRIELEGGPGNGHTVDVERAPVFVRATEWDGHWDVLDQKDDVPNNMEAIHIYRQVAHKRDPLDDNLTIYTYLHYPFDDSIDAATLRYNHNWQAWARLQLQLERARMEP